jgi:uncharacterized coiled-coil protein SlyX
MPDDNDMPADPPPARPPTLFRQQSVRGIPERDQLAERRNELIRLLTERLRDIAEAAATPAEQRELYSELQIQVADFNRGERRYLSIENFEEELANMIDAFTDEQNIDFDHELHQAPAPGGP